MTASSLSISRLINVSVNLSPLPAQMQNLNDLLILGTSDVIDVVSRLRNYTTIAEVAADFGVNSEEYLTAALWFEQVPQPTTLSIGRWAKTATKGTLIGATLSAAQQALSVFTAFATPGFFCLLDGIPTVINPATFAAQTNLNGVASVIQTALAAALVGSTCVWNSVYSRFQIETGTAGPGGTISFLSAPRSVGSVTFAAQPANLDTITLNGTVITFVTGVPAAGQVQISAVNLAGTMTNLLTHLQASVDAQLVKFQYVIDSGTPAHLYLYATTPGAGGDALTVAKSGANITVSGATLTGGSTTDISAALGMTATSSGAYLANGIAAESAVACVTLMDTLFGQAWYATQIPAAVNADHLAVAAYLEAASNKHIYGVTTQEAGVLVASDTSNIAYQLKALLYKRTMTQYSSSNAYAVASALARILTTNYNGNNTVITLMYKQEPGIVAETLNSSQVTALEGFNCNVFLAYNNNTAIFEPGKVASGEFLDVITGPDWLALDIQTSAYNLLYTSPTKIPQTDAGNHQFVAVFESVLSQGVANGLLAPGTWESGGFGSLNTGDFLSKGFYVYAPPVASQSAADRAARKSVVFQIAAKLAGAIHTVDVIINVNR